MLTRSLLYARAQDAGFGATSVALLAGATFSAATGLLVAEVSIFDPSEDISYFLPIRAPTCMQVSPQHVTFPMDTI